MAIDSNQRVLGIIDCKISKLLTDSSTGCTYDAPIDVPGIKEITVSAEIEEKECTGDEVVMATYRKKKKYSVSFANAVLDLDVVALINGGTVTTSGTSPNEVKNIESASTDTANYFLLEFKSAVTDGAGDVHYQVLKVRGNIDIAMVAEDYATCSFEGTAVARTFDNKFTNIVVNETETDIAQVLAES